MGVATLVPKRPIGFGQDFRQDLAIARLGLTVLRQTGDSYPTPQPDTDMLVSFNSDFLADTIALEQSIGQMVRIVHHQLRLTYLDQSARRCGGNSSSRDHALRSLRASDVVVVPAEFLSRQLETELNAQRIVTIRNGADGDLFRPRVSEERARWRRLCGVDQNKILVGYVGELSDAKGFQILQEIARALPESIHLRVRTYDAKRWPADLRGNPKSISIDIDKKSLQRRDHPTPYLDLLLATSLCETVSMVVIESLLSGVPVLATTCTPFFDELRKEGLSTAELDLIELPSGLEDKNRLELKLADNDARRIADEFVGRIAKRSPVEDAKRMHLASRSRAACMESRAMLEQFAALYGSLLATSATADSR